MNDAALHQLPPTSGIDTIMAKKRTKLTTTTPVPPVPLGVVEYLEHFRQAALSGARSAPISTNPETLEYTIAQRRYWMSVAQGLKWVQGHAKRALDRQDKRG